MNGSSFARDWFAAGIENRRNSCWRPRHKIAGKPIDVLRRELLFGGMRLIRGGKA
jgi:hypothetical protein